MIRFTLVAITTGLLFGIMDGLINANPYAVKLLECYKPIARQKINMAAGMVIDLVYGFLITGIYLLLMTALPTENGVIRGLAYGLGIWFFRGLMSVLSSWMMFEIPVKTLVYIAVTGLLEMLILGVFNGVLIQ
jgi:hypothetical protein